MARTHIRLKPGSNNFNKMQLLPHDRSRVVATDGYWDPDLTNGLRADSARYALLHFSQERGLDCDESACAVDLMTDLLHHLHSRGEDPIAALDRARKHFIAEVSLNTAPIIGKSDCEIVNM